MKFQTQDGDQKELKCLMATFDYEDSAVNLGRLPLGATIVKVESGITTNFAGTSPTVDVGTSDDTDAYMDTTDMTVGTAGQYVVYPNSTLTAAATAIITIGGTSLTAGAGVIILLYTDPD